MSYNQNSQQGGETVSLPRKEVDSGSLSVAILIGLIVGLLVAFILHRAGFLTIFLVALIATWLVVWFAHARIYPAMNAYYSSASSSPQRIYDIAAVIIGIVVALFFASIIRRSAECGGAPVSGLGGYGGYGGYGRYGYAPAEAVDYP
jgi:hypothetical protein